ncbi:MAG TPA: methyltransferase [Gaiellaceae bacterium]
MTEARAFLARVGYERERVAAVREEGGDSLLTALVALFIDGVVLGVAEATDVLGEGVELLTAAGLLTRTAETVKRAVLLVPHEGLLIASDDPGYDGNDYVTGVQRPSHILALLTPRRRVRSAADIGTGCGIQALLAARFADRVVATDLNERALEFCELNAGLNGVDTIETRPGSFLEPLGGEKFDLVVANPPYVVSPSTAFLFRDAGRGDAVSEELVRGIEPVLEPRGHAVVMISWVANDDEGVERPLTWIGGDSGAVLIVTDVKDAVADAKAWIDASGSAEPEAELERWHSWYREWGIEQLAYGAVVLRRGGRGRRVLAVGDDARIPTSENLLKLLDELEHAG